MKNLILPMALALLLSTGAIAQKSSTGRDSSPLIHAATAGDVEAAQQALTTSDLESTNREDRTALHIAAQHGDREMVLFLLESGASLEAVDFKGQTPLHLAAGAGHFNVVDDMLAAGADPNVTDNAGNTPVHAAAKGGHNSATRSLLREGGKANVTNEKGQTPADVAAYARVGSWDQVERLLRAQAAEEK
jgi:ankyrin repeat protein